MSMTDDRLDRFIERARRQSYTERWGDARTPSAKPKRVAPRRYGITKDIKRAQVVKRRNEDARAAAQREKERLAAALEAQGLPEPGAPPCEPGMSERDARAKAARLTREEGERHEAIKCGCCPGWHVECP